MTLEETIADIRDRSAYFLNDAADCASPDKPDSPGARFLIGIRNDVLESWESNDAETPAGIEYWEDVIREIADQAPSIYTYTMWCEFVDLAAYQEDIEDYGEFESMDRGASLALTLIAERLAHSLFEELVDAKQEDADAERDEDDEEDSFDAIALGEIVSTPGVEIIDDFPIGSVVTTEHGMFRRVEDDGDGRTWVTTSPAEIETVDERGFWCDNCQDYHF